MIVSESPKTSAASSSVPPSSKISVASVTMRACACYAGRPVHSLQGAPHVTDCGGHRAIAAPEEVGAFLASSPARKWQDIERGLQGGMYGKPYALAVLCRPEENFSIANSIPLERRHVRD